MIHGGVAQLLKHTDISTRGTVNLAQSAPWPISSPTDEELIDQMVRQGDISILVAESILNHITIRTPLWQVLFWLSKPIETQLHSVTSCPSSKRKSMVPKVVSIFTTTFHQ